MPDLGYRAGEILTWSTQGDDNTTSIPERRPVFFVSYEDAQSALISYGLRDGAPRHVKVLVSELSREAPPPLDPAFFPNGTLYSVPVKPPPLTEDQLSQRLLTARTKLRSAHERVEQARQQVAAARVPADRAANQVEKLQQELRQLALQDAEHSRQLEAALREGQDIPEGNIAVNRSQLEARLKVTEATASRLTSELTSAHRRQSDALEDVKVAARQVVTVLLSREAENLRQQIAAVCLKFTELTSAAELNLGTTTPLLLDSTTAELLSVAVIVPRDSVEVRRTSTESRTLRWRQLWVRLLDGGDTDADFEPHVQEH